MRSFDGGRDRGSNDAEPRLLREIGKLTARVREMRLGDAMTNQAQIKALEEQVRAKWTQLREARAGPRPDGLQGDPRHRRGLYE